nr:hypothetical protein BaRGS_009377 [Batillaria attramentaria]
MAILFVLGLMAVTVRNADNVVTEAELAEYCRLVDTNDDDSVTYGEFTGGRPALQNDDTWRAMFAEFDTIDTNIDPAHRLCRGAPKYFLALTDNNSDGEIERAEFEDFMTKLTQSTHNQEANITFAAFDRNGDDMVTVAELEEYCKMVDTNGDHMVTFAEFTGGRPALQHDRIWRLMFDGFDQIDTNVDQNIDCVGGPPHFITLADTNGDGEIEETEFDELKNKMIQNDGKVGFEEFLASRQNWASSTGPGVPRDIMKATFMYYDTMGGTQTSDGFITREEVKLYFNMIDRNGDGLVNEQEFDQSFAQGWSVV